MKNSLQYIFQEGNSYLIKNVRDVFEINRPSKQPKFPWTYLKLRKKSFEHCFLGKQSRTQIPRSKVYLKELKVVHALLKISNTLCWISEQGERIISERENDYTRELRREKLVRNIYLFQQWE